MTCIVGVLYGNKIFMGADSAGVSGLDFRIRKDPKLFVKEVVLDSEVENTDVKILIGCSGSYRMCQILQYNLTIPRNYLIFENPYEYMITNFIPELRSTFKSHGYSQIHDNVESHDGLFLIGFANSLFTIYSDFQVAEVKEKYTAIGSGQSYALGCLHGLRNLGMGEFEAKIQIEYALEAAEYFNAGVRKPFTILEV